MASGSRQGPFQANARIEWEWEYPDVTQGTSSIVVSVRAYLRMDGSSSIAGTWPKSRSGFWGSASENQTYSLGASQRVLIWSWSQSVALTDVSQHLSPFNASAQHFHGTTSDAMSFWVPPRFAVAPSGLTVTRVSDSRHDLSWSRNSTYTSVVVQRRTNNGGWVEVGRPSGNAFSFSDVSTEADRKYDYRVAGVGGSGQSAWSNTVTVYTTPAPVASVSAVRSGDDIVVSVAGVPPYATAFDVYDDGVLVGSNVSFPWVDVAPNPGVTHTYTVRSKRGGLVSAHSVPSNTVQLQAPPNAPTNLVPNGALRPFGVQVLFGWQHNPVDSSGQTQAQVQYRPVGQLVWKTDAVTSPDSVYSTFLTNQPANEQVVGDFEWQVRTRGAHPDWSPWSAVGTVTVIDRPTVAINVPGPTHDQPVLGVEWAYSQAQSYPQSSWKAELVQGATVLETKTGTGSVNAVTFATRVVDGGTYGVRVTAATGDVESLPAYQEVAVAFTPPADPVVTGGWNDVTGSVDLLVDAGSGGVPTETILVERSVDGETWETVMTVEPGFEVPDWEALSYGVTEYRVTAVAATGAAASIVYPVEARSGAFWLSGGINFTRTARLPFNPSATFTDARSRSAELYEGRTLPVAYAGEHEQTTVAITGRLIDRDDHSVEVDELRSLVRDREPVHMFRDPDGHRIYVQVGASNIPRQQAIDRADGWAGVWQYSLTLTQVDRG